MSFATMFATDETAEIDRGVEVDYGNGVKVRMLRAGGSNSKFTKLLARKLKPYRRQLESDSMDEKEAARIMAEVYAESILLGWEGVTDFEGHPVKCDRAGIVKTLCAFPEFFRRIQADASDLALFRIEEREAVIKNSPKSSSGS